MRDPACRHRLCPGEWIDRGDGTLITCPCGCHDAEAREHAALDRLEREREVWRDDGTYECVPANP